MYPYHIRHWQTVWTNTSLDKIAVLEKSMFFLEQQAKLIGFKGFRPIMIQRSFVSASRICSLVHKVFVTWTDSGIRQYMHIWCNIPLKLVFFQRLTGLWQVAFLQWLTSQTTSRIGIGNKRLPVFPVRFKLFLCLSWIHFYFGNFYTRTVYFHKNFDKAELD